METRGFYRKIEMGKLVDLMKENTITATATAAATTTNYNWGVVACELFLSTLPYQNNFIQVYALCSRPSHMYVISFKVLRRLLTLSIIISYPVAWLKQNRGQTQINKASGICRDAVHRIREYDIIYPADQRVL